MPGCTLEREILGGTARYAITGRFDGACAWELARRIESEPLAELALDFSQCADFVDYGVAVVANAVLAAPQKRVQLRGLRDHQVRLFKYFGVDADAPAQRPDALAVAAGLAAPPVKEVA